MAPPVWLKDPTYPVIYTEPNFTQIVSNFRYDDYKLMGLGTLFGAAFGFYIGHPQNISRTSMKFGIFFVGSAMFTKAYLRSAERLLGFRENDIEVDHLKKGAPGSGL